MNILEKSWNSFSPNIAKKYLRGHGHPSENSKKILLTVIKNNFGAEPVRIIDLGCGNAQLLEYFKKHDLSCEYTGVDISIDLLKVAKKNHGSSKFILDDINQLSRVFHKYDLAIYSHVVELIASPDRSLLAATKFSSKIAIRFYEPPNFEFDTNEIREMDTGAGKKVPFLRRKMSRDYYKLILSKINCKRVDVYPDPLSKDEVHLLHF
jgi:SAM-dependent methyltransferase